MLGLGGPFTISDNNTAIIIIPKLKTMNQTVSTQQIFYCFCFPVVRSFFVCHWFVCLFVCLFLPLLFPFLCFSSVSLVLNACFRLTNNLRDTCGGVYRLSVRLFFCFFFALLCFSCFLLLFPIPWETHRRLFFLFEFVPNYMSFEIAEDRNEIIFGVCVSASIGLRLG